MKLTSLVLSLLFFCITNVYAETPCRNLASDYDRYYCFSKFLSVSDKALNENYQHLRNCLKNDNQKSILRKAQLKWLKFRESSCIETNPVRMMRCTYNLNLQRTEFLQKRNRECEAGYIDERKLFRVKNQLPEQPPSLTNAKYAFESDNNNFLAVCNNCIYSSGKYPNSAMIHVDSADNYFAQWNVFTTNRDKVVIKDGHEKFLARAETDTRGVVKVYSTYTNNPNAQWYVTYLKNGKIALSDGTGHYLCRCNNCYTAAYPNVADMHCTHPNDPWAQWTPKLLSEDYSCHQPC
jgi:uncharacterized protein YecT (DUF1311 family)